VAGERIRFGTFALEPRAGVLRRRGLRCPLQSQPFRLLVLLVEHSGELVTRERIREHLWPDTTVTYDQSINFAVRQIRIVLGDDAGLIQTIPRRGYRFAGECNAPSAVYAATQRDSSQPSNPSVVARLAGHASYFQEPRPDPGLRWPSWDADGRASLHDRHVRSSDGLLRRLIRAPKLQQRSFGMRSPGRCASGTGDCGR
jgi:DNA-binding winged helix-turn-helix (wHTH) protein